VFVCFVLCHLEVTKASLHYVHLSMYTSRYVHREIMPNSELPDAHQLHVQAQVRSCGGVLLKK
jgi:hypothetical protein